MIPQASHACLPVTSEEIFQAWTDMQDVHGFGTAYC